MALSSAESEYYSMVRCARDIIGLANTIRELGHEAHGSSTRTGIPHQTHGNEVLLAAAERETTKSSGSRRSEAQSVQLTY